MNLAEKMKAEIKQRRLRFKADVVRATKISPPVLKRILAGEIKHTQPIIDKIRKFCPAVDETDYVKIEQNEILTTNPLKSKDHGGGKPLELYRSSELREKYL